MRSLTFVVASVAAAALLGAAGCKDKQQDPPSPKPSGEAAGGAAGAGAGTAAEPPAEDGPPPLPPAPPPQAATDQACVDAGASIGAPLREIAAALKVPEGKVDATADALGKAFGDLCAGADWPTTAIDCLMRNKADPFTFARCLDRLPAAAKQAWDERLVEIVAQAGGTPPDPPAGATVSGKPFEEVCASFVAEMARLEGCAGMSYSPTLEQVYVQRRQVEVGGLIPDEAIDDLRSLCARRTTSAQNVAARMCPRP